MVSSMTHRAERQSAKRRRLFGRFRADLSGVAAIEFALLLPLMLAMYFGAYEVGTAYSISRKVSHLTSALADLVTQSKTLSNADMANILDAAAAIMVPYSEANLTIQVTGVTIDSKGKAKVTWSDALNTDKLAVGSVVNDLPEGVNIANSFLVTAEIHYDYTPSIGYMLTGSFDVNDQFYLKPRLSSTITRTN